MITRRKFLQYLAKTTAQVAAAAAFGRNVMAATAGAAPAVGAASAGSSAAIRDLKSRLGADAQVLSPYDADLTQYKNNSFGYNLRLSRIAPMAVIMPKNIDGVANTIGWARQNGVPVHPRGGRHSYEGFSQGQGLILDMGLMNTVQVDAQTGAARIGAGARLGGVYAANYQYKKVLPAGTCPTVGVVGLATGGGYGLISRKFGLTCDQVQRLTMVDAKGNVIVADATQNADLLWASRGGGGGQFGVVTELDCAIHPIDTVCVFYATWPVTHARAVTQAWQAWAPFARDELTCHLKLEATPAGLTSVNCGGEFVGGEADLRAAFAPLLKEVPPQSFTVKTMPFDQAVDHFAGNKAAPPTRFKAMSDYAVKPLSDEGIDVLLKAIPLVPGAIVVIFDAYGGEINRVPADATAFFHRSALYSVQYDTHWSSDAQTPGRMQAMNELYRRLRPYFSGYAYYNYCDLGLENWQHAYWGDNFARLTEVKKAYDPENFFNHAQSIPLPG